ncbi:MAG TPA: aminomethyltransferase family protein [Pyrinomonadaceae bacterium]|jgi:folate-binding protein YgfZ
MSEATEQATIHKSPLDDAHRRAGAVFRERDGRMLPSSYGDTLAEYVAVRDGESAGLIDLSSNALIEVSGAEAVQFLNGLVTNDMKTLLNGAWMPAAFPNAQGRLISVTRIINRGGAFLFNTESVSRTTLYKTLERFTLAGDFHVTDRSDETAQLSVQGARAEDVVRRALGQEAASVGHGRVIETTRNGATLSVMRATHTAEDGFDIFVDAAHAAPVWDALREAGARPTGMDALEILRIEAGVPRYGLDMDETNVVTEAGLDDAVSYTKGCYIGQEIIARIHWRGHVAKKLAGLTFTDEGEVERGAKVISADGKEIGRVTSATFSPRLSKTIALAYIKYDYLAPGTTARVITNDAERAATVAELPLVRGSWFDRDENAEAGA